MLVRMSEELGAWVSRVDRIHELMATTIRTHPDEASRSALRCALVVLEELREEMKAADVRDAFVALGSGRYRG